MSKQITAIIHLAKRGRSASNRYGKFLRPDKVLHEEAVDLHLWEGRELSIKEFNELFPVAIRSVLGTDTVFGKIIEREVEDTDGGADKEAQEKLKTEHEAALEALKLQYQQAEMALNLSHGEALAAVQKEVNDFTAHHNENLAEARNRIAELEAKLADAGTSTSQPNPEAEEKPADETISEEQAAPSEGSPAPLVEAAPPAAGEQPEASITHIPTPEAEAEAPKAASKAAPKAKAPAKK